MGNGDRTIELPELPADDLAIAEALDDVGTRLAAWSAAVTEAHRALASLAQERVETLQAAVPPPDVPVPPPEPAASPQEPPEAAQASLPADTADTPPAPEEVPEPLGESPAPVIEDEKLAGPPVEDLIAPAADSRAESPDPSPTDAAAGQEGVGEPETALREETEEDNDEAVLASLDAETAQAIRVMRRLSPDKRTVRKLLEEYRATQAAHAASPARKKKSWWSRGQS